MKKVQWLSHNNFPSKKKTYWGMLNKRLIKSNSLNEQNECIKRWQPQQKLLINLDAFSRMLPPIYCKRYQPRITKNLKYKYNVISIATIIPVYIFLFLCIFLDYKLDLQAVGSALGFVSLSLAYALTYKLGLSSIKLIKERSLFYNWLLNSYMAKKSFVICLLFGLFIACFQLLSIKNFGSNDVVFSIYGFMYQRVLEHEYWRLITGPNLHYSIIHFFTNYLMLLMIGTLSIALTGYKSIFIFFVGNIIGSYSQYAFGGNLFDSFGGISPGNFALLAWTIGYNLLYKKIFPKGIVVTIIFVMAVSSISSELSNLNSATISHIMGLASGLFFAIIYSSILKIRN
jgi:membrane associated rhomboid family serine protease